MTSTPPASNDLPEDQALVVLLQSGDQALIAKGMELTYKKYYMPIYQWIRQWHSVPEDVEDLVQDLMIKLSRMAVEGRLAIKTASLRTYLYKMAHSSFISWLRRQILAKRYVTLSSIEYKLYKAIDEDAHDILATKEYAEKVQTIFTQAAAKLPEQHRVIVETFLDMLKQARRYDYLPTNPAIADKVAQSHGQTVSVRQVSYALERFAEHVTRLLDAGDR